MYRKLPKAVQQQTTWSCWAAGMESWLDGVLYRRKATQQELIEEYATHSNGGLDPISAGTTAHRDFETLAGDFSIDYVVRRGNQLTEDFLDERLKHGLVLLIYTLRPGVAHANVVYGVGYPTGKERRISVMDPAIGGYVNRLRSFYASRTAVIVGWPQNLAE